MPPPSVWRTIPSDRLDGWNARLLKDGASLFQLPFWNEPLRALRFVPRYLEYAVEGESRAYVCVLSLGVPGVRIGLVQRGPVPLGDGTLLPEAIPDLARWARRRGYAFLRFTHSDADLLKSVAELPGGRQADAFPFYREPGTDLLVAQDATDDVLLARFQPVARRQIRKASAAGYLIESSSSPEVLRAAWPLFQKLAARKGFNYRPLESYAAVLRAAAPYGAARVFTVRMDGELLQAIIVVRDGTTAHYVGGALDVDALGKRHSPSELLHWRAMREFAAQSVKWYNLGSRSGPVYTFKREFRPLEVDHPPPVTLVTNRPLFALWWAIALPLVRSNWSRLKRIAARVLGGRSAATGHR